jgi:hypothetical protein
MEGEMRLRALAAVPFLALAASGHVSATVYNPATDFASGWASATNPNGVWSYGFSSTVTGAVTLYTGRVAGADSPNQLFWISPGNNCCIASPAVGFNKGPAFDDGNVALAADQMDLVASVSQNLATDLVFTAPSSGNYSLTTTFIGAQRGIGVSVYLLKNAASLFSSSVTAFGQLVPFDTTLSLTAGDSVEFVVLQGSGLQNTGLDVSLSSGAVPEPSTWAMMLAGFASLGFAAWRGGARVRAA